MIDQEEMALAIVSMTGLVGVFWFFRSFLAGYVSQWLLRHDYIKAAMWFRHRVALKSGCSRCKG